ncbi:hypothetical protein NQ318_016334 [Aromia moschata]|uniref:Uncharacterized protein n=1 Tax=Aromia moschata TaxID=1265417 RepID=A0AAV8Z5F4_9CUCU|nr:hypothetical protein NQ318_016334 [Aromia moschata]
MIVFEYSSLYRAMQQQAFYSISRKYVHDAQQQVRRCVHSLRKKSNCSVVIGITHRDSHVTLDPTGDSRRTNANHDLHTASRLAIAYKLANSSAVKNLFEIDFFEPTIGNSKRIPLYWRIRRHWARGEAGEQERQERITQPRLIHDSADMTYLTAASQGRIRRRQEQKDALDIIDDSNILYGPGIDDSVIMVNMRERQWGLGVNTNKQVLGAYNRRHHSEAF